ncbi:hypothetical protein DWUX_492 [Desulfovibrio diazotrophicus]|jgi:hypothetical protein|nr:hypothetical protein DWUX_492 [Desulfovibrio diazotrophicus]VVU42822.1 hypothetical protein DWUX_168 [Desulfovibrio diazotrophicus]
MFNNNLLCKIYDIDKVKKVKKSPAGGWFLLEKIDTINALAMLPTLGGFHCPLYVGI